LPVNILPQFYHKIYCPGGNCFHTGFPHPIPEVVASINRSPKSKAFVLFALNATNFITSLANNGSGGLYLWQRGHLSSAIVDHTLSSHSCGVKGVGFKNTPQFILLGSNPHHVPQMDNGQITFAV